MTKDPIADDRLTKALRRKRETQPWNELVTRELVADPQVVKSQASHCATCDAPCERDELCATVVAAEGGLLDDVGRDQAFAHVESAFRRLRLRDAAATRKMDTERPHYFITLTNPGSE